MAGARDWALRLGFALLIFAAAGCNRNSHTSDPHLRQLDQILSHDLPPGTTEARVIYYLNSRGDSLEPSAEPGTVVAVIHHVNISPLDPVAARVTFRFDEHGKLTRYEMTATQ